jgi:hypothetical protein
LVEDPQHVEELRRLLSRLQFSVMQDRFDCTRTDLKRVEKLLATALEGKTAEPKEVEFRPAVTGQANPVRL